MIYTPTSTGRSSHLSSECECVAESNGTMTEEGIRLCNGLRCRRPSLPTWINHNKYGATSPELLPEDLSGLPRNKSLRKSAGTVGSTGSRAFFKANHGVTQEGYPRHQFISAAREETTIMRWERRAGSLPRTSHPLHGVTYQRRRNIAIRAFREFFRVFPWNGVTYTSPLGKPCTGSAWQSQTGR